MTNPKPLCVAALAGLLIAGIASCSSGSPSTTSAGTTPSPATATAAAAKVSAVPSATAGAGVLHACKLLSKAKADAATGLKFTSTKELPFSTFGTVCSFSSTDFSLLQVGVLDQGTITLDALKVGLAGAASKDAPLVAVHGVGDQAWASADGLIASFGTHIVQVQGLQADLFGKHAAAEAVAEAVIAAAG